METTRTLVDHLIMSMATTTATTTIITEENKVRGGLIKTVTSLALPSMTDTYVDLESIEQYRVSSPLAEVFFRFPKDGSLNICEIVSSFCSSSSATHIDD